MHDFRALQYHIANLQAHPRPEEYYLEGYAWFRQSVAEAQAVLAQEYSNDAQHPQGDAEAEKSLLKLYVTSPTSWLCCISRLVKISPRGHLKSTTLRL